MWNSLPGALVTLPSFSDSPENFPFQVDYNNDEGFTAIIYCQLGLSLTPSAPLYRLVTNVARSKYVSKVSIDVLRLTHFNREFMTLCHQSRHRFSPQLTDVKLTRNIEPILKKIQRFFKNGRYFDMF